MAYPGVRFVLEQDGREQFRSDGTGHLADVLIATLGLNQFRDMLPVEGADDENTIQVTGYTSAPSAHRADRSRIILYVNGRWIQDASLSYAVVQAYHTYLMTGRYPITVLMIEVPPEDVDVNVHPAKAEVRFRDPNMIFSVVQRAVRRTVVDGAQPPALQRENKNNGWAEHGQPRSDRQLNIPLDLDSPGDYRHQRAATEETDDPTRIPIGPQPPQQPRTLPILRVVGQIGASYIVTEGPAGMYLIDQHAAHERILYEQFMMEYARKGPIAQFALSAQTVELPADEAQMLEAQLDTLSAIGLKLESFGTNTFLIRSVPAILSDRDPTEIVYGVIEELERGDAPGAQAIEEKIIKQVCKQAAVKAGTILSIEQMRGLIQQLERCQSPHTCPHGRPTMLHMSSEQITREFGRK
jgi:DNA mismatch repair protein MutL